MTKREYIKKLKALTVEYEQSHVGRKKIISEALRADIRQIYKLGMTQRELAILYGVSPLTIFKIVHELDNSLQK